MLFLNNFRKKNVHLILILAPRGASIFLGGGYKLLYNKSFIYIYIDNKSSISFVTEGSPQPGRLRFGKKVPPRSMHRLVVSTAWSSFQRSLTHRRSVVESGTTNVGLERSFFGSKGESVYIYIYIYDMYIYILYIIWIKKMSCLTRCYKQSPQ